jgi:hypothetical protein
VTLGDVPSRPVRRALAVAAAMVFVAGAVLLRIVPRPVTLHGPGDLAADIPKLQAFVERTRGRRFHYQVPIRRSDALKFFNRSDPGDAEKDDEADRQARLEAGFLLSLGLIDKPFDPDKAKTSLDSEVLGIYDPGKRQLLVRPGPITPYARMVLVHELTHALDDEYHELRRPETFDVDESDMSFRALAEGDAVFVERRYLDSLPPDERKQIEDIESSAPPPSPDVPDVLRALAAYPYVVGEKFVTALVDKDGARAPDKAFDNPPSTSEQVFHPDKYLAGEEGRDVAKPTPDGQDVIERGVLGELLLLLMLNLRSPDQAAADQAKAAAAGWGGGRYVAWSNGDDVCVKAKLVMDTPNDRREALVGLQRWAVGKPRANVSLAADAKTIELANCVNVPAV